MVHPWGVELDKEKALNDSYQVGRNAFCRNKKTDQELVDCLRDKPSSLLISAAILVSYRDVIISYISTRGVHMLGRAFGRRLP